MLWTPTDSGRHALALLADEAALDLVVTHWPLPSAAVARALDALPADLPAPLASARATVRAELQGQRSAQAGADLASRVQRMPGFGQSSTPGSWAALRSAAWEGDHVAAQLGARVEAKPQVDRRGGDARLEDATVATEALGVQLQAWSHRSWWSPGWQTALALSNNAPAFNAVGLQRASASASASPWLAWMGPWNLEAFVAQTEDVTQPARPFLLGIRWTFKPARFLEFAVTDMAQWGGKGRPQSPRDFLDLFTRRHTHDYVAGDASTDVSNGLAGFDWRARCPVAWRCTVYGQLIGEDEAGNHVPMKYLGMYGLEHWSDDGRWRVYGEFVESTCGAPSHRHPAADCAYRNYAYPQGYASGGRWIGASVGPDSHVLTLGWLDAPARRHAKLFYGWIGSRAGNFAPVGPDPRYAGRLVGVDLAQTWDWRGAQLMPHLSWSRTAAEDGPRNALAAGLQATVSWR